MTTRTIDLNADVGESYGVYRIGSDEELLKYVTSANLACGWHAGDPVVMERTVRLARGLGVAVGAHPGYPDLLGFGRRNMQISKSQAQAYVLYQLGALSAFTRTAGCPLRHIKLHGAFYNQVAAEKELARGVLDAVERFDRQLIVVGLSGSALLREAEQRGLRVAHEVFADRAYDQDGSLVPRGRAGAVIEDHEAAARRAVRMVTEGIVDTNDGHRVRVAADTICVHGDHPGAVDLARTVRESLERAGVKVARLGESE